MPSIAQSGEGFGTERPIVRELAEDELDGVFARSL
jgi:hypothetical protein